MIHTIEVSPVESLGDGLVMVTAHVDSLAGRGDCTFAFPPEPESSKALVILLHGVYGSHWAWPLSGRAGATLADLVTRRQIRPMVLAMPSDGLAGYSTAYRNSSLGRFRDWIMVDVPEVARLIAPYLPSVRFIGGLSMGGWGAVTIGATAPSIFSGIAAHSAITTEEDINAFASGPQGFESLPENQPADLAELIIRAQHPPPLYFDCGLDDPLLESNRRLNRQLEIAAVPHEYHEFEGGHDWGYWALHLADSLRFFDSLL